MTLEVEGPNGIIVEFPDGTSRKIIQAAMAKKFGGPKGKSKPAPKQEDRGYLEALGAGALQLPVDILSAGYGGVANVLDLVGQNKMAAQVRQSRDESKNRAMAQINPRTQNYPVTSGLGNFGANLMVTAPLTAGVGGLISRAAPTVARASPAAARVVANIGQATKTGGMGVRGVGSRLAGGALAGGTSAALTGQDVLTGAAIGGGIPVVGGLLGKTFGAGYDVIARRVGKTKAAEMLRKAVGDNLERVKSALASATPDEQRSLLQFLESKDIKIPQLAAIEKNVAQSGQAQPLREAAQRTGEELAGLRADVRRGGQTATEAEQIIKQDRRNLMQATEEPRQSGIAAMDVGRTQIVPAEQQAAAARATQQEQLDAARRLAGSAEFHEQSPMFTMGADAATHMAEQAGNTAQQAEQLAGNLRSQGLAPIDIRPIVKNLRAQASDAEHVDPDQFTILSDFANRLEARAAKFGGIIDAEGFYKYRKNANKQIQSLLAGRPQAAKEYTAQLIGDLRGHIDNAIRAAGGDELLQSINTVSAGLKDLEQQGVAANLARIQQKHPERFARIMAGEEPGIVRQLTDHETGDITEALGSRIADVQKLAGVSNPSVMRGKFYIPDETPGATDLRRGVASEAADIMSPGVPLWARATGQLMAAKVPGGGRAGAVLEGTFGDKMKTSILNKMAPALANPNNAAALMGEVPTSEVLANYIAGLSPQARNLMAQSLISGGLYSQKPSY
jgi:hypothetical protein